MDNLNVGNIVNASTSNQSKIPFMDKENVSNNADVFNDCSNDTSLSFNVSNLVPAVILPILFARDIGKLSRLGQHSDGDSESTCPSGKFVDQWEEGEINSDDERYTLNDLYTFGKALLSYETKDDSEWTFVKSKNS